MPDLACVRRRAAPVSIETLYRKVVLLMVRESRSEWPSGEIAKSPIAPSWNLPLGPFHEVARATTTTMTTTPPETNQVLRLSRSSAWRAGAAGGFRSEGSAEVPGSADLPRLRRIQASMDRPSRCHQMVPTTPHNANAIGPLDSLVNMTPKAKAENGRSARKRMPNGNAAGPFKRG